MSTDKLLSELKQIVSKTEPHEPGIREVLVFNIGLKQEIKPVLLDGRSPVMVVGESVISICTSHPKRSHFKEVFMCYDFACSISILLLS